MAGLPAGRAVNLFTSRWSLRITRHDAKVKEEFTDNSEPRGSERGGEGVDKVRVSDLSTDLFFFWWMRLLVGQWPALKPSPVRSKQAAAAQPW